MNCNIMSKSTIFSSLETLPPNLWDFYPTRSNEFGSCLVTGSSVMEALGSPSIYVERCGAVVKRRTRDREVPGSIPTNSKCCFLEQETLSTLLSTGFYLGKKRATGKISTRFLNVLPSINKVDYYYYYYYHYFVGTDGRGPCFPNIEN